MQFVMIMLKCNPNWTAQSANSDGVAGSQSLQKNKKKEWLRVNSSLLL